MPLVSLAKIVPSQVREREGERGRGEGREGKKQWCGVREEG